LKNRQNPYETFRTLIDFPYASAYHGSIRVAVGRPSLVWR
jgi:hypothetical protein